MYKAFRRYWRTCTRVKTQAPVCSNLIDASIYFTSRTAILWSITKVSNDCCPITTLTRQMITPCTRPSARETSRRGSDEEHQKAGSDRHPDNQRGIDQRACTEILSPRSKTALSLATGTMRWPLDQWASKLSMLRLHSTSRSFVQRSKHARRFSQLRSRMTKTSLTNKWRATCHRLSEPCLKVDVSPRIESQAWGECAVTA